MHVFKRTRKAMLEVGMDKLPVFIGFSINTQVRYIYLATGEWRWIKPVSACSTCQVGREDNAK